MGRKMEPNKMKTKEITKEVQETLLQIFVNPTNTFFVKIQLKWLKENKSIKLLNPNGLVDWILHEIHYQQFNKIYEHSTQ